MLLLGKCRFNGAVTFYESTEWIWNNKSTADLTDVLNLWKSIILFILWTSHPVKNANKKQTANESHSMPLAEPYGPMSPSAHIPSAHCWPPVCDRVSAVAYLHTRRFNVGVIDIGAAGRTGRCENHVYRSLNVCRANNTKNDGTDTHMPNDDGQIR